MKILFLDRDGVINIDKVFVSNPDDFEFIDDIFPLCHKYKKLGYLIIVVTNQTGIGLNKYTLDDFYKVNQKMLEGFEEKGIHIDDVFFCQHNPIDNCTCHKPHPGMFLQALEKYHVKACDCLMVGDKSSDAIAAHKAGIEQIYLFQKKDKGEIPFPFKIVESLKEI